MKTKFNVLIIALIVVFVATFTACEEPEPTVTVYTGTISPTEFESVFNGWRTPPNVGYFIRDEISVGVRDYYASSLNTSPSISKVEWTKSDISNFFISSGFKDPQRTELINWFNGEDHAYLYHRASEDTVNIILK